MNRSTNYKSAAKTTRFSPDKSIFLFLGLIISSLLTFSGQSLAQHSLLDPSFDGDGKSFAQFLPTNNVANNAVLQPDGKIIVVGSASAGPTFPQTMQAALVRFNADGSLDTT